MTKENSVKVSFEKLEADTLFYTMEISDILIPLTEEPMTKTTEDEIIYDLYHLADKAVSTYYKKPFIDEPVQLSKIFFLVECNLQTRLSPYGYCICGDYLKPTWDDNPDVAQYCSCRNYAD